jgi:dTDP-4-dehydrorhamnose 3,5-epimerase
MVPPLLVEPTDLPGVLVVTARRHPDPRGHVTEPWDADRWRAAGLPDAWTTLVESYSPAVGTLRGLHAQRGQGKVVRCAAGAMWDVVVDARADAPTRGRWVAIDLSAANGRQVVIPPGFLHGFVSRAPHTLTLYRTSRPYDPAEQVLARWDDPSLGIPWPITRPLLSTRDAEAPDFATVAL